MEQYTLLAEIQNTVFFYHTVQETNNKETTYNIYRALDHIKLLNDTQTAVIVFDVLTEDTMDVIAIQHKESSSLKKFDKENLEQIFNLLKKNDTPRKIFMLNYYIDRETYETNVIDGVLPNITDKKITAIEYVEFHGKTISEEISSNLEPISKESKSTEEPVVEDGNLDQPMNLENLPNPQ